MSKIYSEGVKLWKISFLSVFLWLKFTFFFFSKQEKHLSWTLIMNSSDPVGVKSREGLYILFQFLVQSSWKAQISGLMPFMSWTRGLYWSLKESRNILVKWAEVNSCGVCSNEYQGKLSCQVRKMLHLCVTRITFSLWPQFCLVFWCLPIVATLVSRCI